MPPRRDEDSNARAAAAAQREATRLEHFNPYYALSGFVVGAVVGMTGVGGGSLITPVLVLLFGVSPATAGGTDHLYAAATKGGGTLVHAYNRTVAWHIVAWLAAGSLPTAVVTLYLLSRVGVANTRIAHAITLSLGVALLLTALSLLFRARLHRIAEAWARPSRPRRRILTLVTGASLGFFVSISSVGAGALGVTALLLLYPRLPAVRIVGTDIAHAVPLTLIAGAGHWWLGSVDVAMLLSLLAGSLPGIAIASAFAPRMPENFLRPALALILTIVGARLIFA